MKNALRKLPGLTIVVATAAAALNATPASALALFGTAGSTLSAIPGMETLALGLIGLGCLGLARQRANP